MSSHRTSKAPKRRGLPVAIVAGAVLFVPGAGALETCLAVQPARRGNRAAASRPVEKVLPATVTEVQGDVDWAKAGVSPIASKGWTPLRVNDVLKPGTQIRTGLRSYVLIQFGETTVVSLRSVTHAGLDQLYRTATTEHIRIGLGYGTVRGGSSEGTVRSDVVIDSTVATLAKRGTEGWQMRVEPMTGRFTISLAEFGLVEARRKLASAMRTSRSVRPGESVSDRTIADMWIKQDIFNRDVRFYQADSMTAADANFSSENTRGLGVLVPGGGSTLVDASARVDASFVLDQIEQNFPGAAPPRTMVLVPTSVSRPEGNFGTGPTFRVLLPTTQERRRPKPPGD